MEEKSPKKIRFNYPRIITAFFLVVAVVGAIALGNNYIAVLLLVVSAIGARELCYAFEDEKPILLITFYTLLGVVPFFVLYFLNVGFGANYAYLLIALCLIMTGLIVNLWFGKINYSRIRFPFTLIY